MRDVCLGAYMHQDLPFEKLVEELQPERDLTRHPLFDVLFNFDDGLSMSLDLPGLTVTRRELTEPLAKFSMTLYAGERQGQLNLRLVYRQALFSAARVRCLLEQLEYLLEQMVAEPEAKIRDYSLVTARSRSVLPDPRIRLPEPEQPPVTSLFSTWVERKPEQPAVSQAGNTWSYGELARQANVVARVLTVRRIKRGEVVAVCGRRSFGLVCAVMGVILSGGTFLLIDAIDLTYVAIQSPPEIFAQLIKKNSFDISEMSASLYLTLKSRRQEKFPFIALPIFPLRMFRHGYIFVNRRSGVTAPKDLEGKRVGVPEYRQTAAVWIRGLLKNEYGVSIESFRWYEGGANRARPYDPDMDLRPLKETRVETLGEGKTLSRMLADGGIDALLGARRPDSLRTCADVVRLFPNYREVERDYYKRTGIFPIMHVLVIKESLYRDNPWIAESLYKACEESKNRCLEQMRFSGSLRYTLPWLFADLDEIDEVFDGDPWPYGIESNRRTLEMLVQYLVEQYFIEKSVALEEVFAEIVTWNE